MISYLGTYFIDYRGYTYLISYPGTYLIDYRGYTYLISYPGTYLIDYRGYTYLISYRVTPELSRLCCVVSLKTDRVKFVTLIS